MRLRLATVTRTARSIVAFVVISGIVFSILPLRMLQGAIHPTTSRDRTASMIDNKISRGNSASVVMGHRIEDSDHVESLVVDDDDDDGDEPLDIHMLDGLGMDDEDLLNSDVLNGPYSSVAVNSTQNTTAAEALVPAFFILGDSTVDCGNNNFLGTFARADIPPYGRDFDTHNATGRFCNGRLTVDYIANLLGLPFVPPYLSQGRNIENMLQGVNFASAGAGILYSSGSDLGQHISLTQQIQQASDMIQDMSLILGQEATHERISKSIFYISIASNDYIHFYLRNISGVQSLHPPWRFNQLLLEAVSRELQHLYNANVRKIVCLGMGPIGCAPRYLWERNTNGGECVSEVNNMIIEYNFALRYMVDQLNVKLPGVNIIFCNIYDGTMDILENPQSYGLEMVSNACCGIGKYGGAFMCVVPEMACLNASKYVWWDAFHPTDIVNSIMSDNMWSGKRMNICHPMNLHDLVTASS